IFDIVISLSLLLIFFPIMLLVGIAILLDSPGPVLYLSKRVGTGYKIFDFYKFRTMKVGADKELQALLHLNQYSVNGQSSFIKINNDPRVTRLGAFLRKSSLDELPQLFNVLKGDMSLVGNRPLPLYEAEKLTIDNWSKRFLAPAGITGLWQVTKRGKAEMSEQERVELDVAYADRASFWFDMKILARTLPALVQKEKV
ncbi:MAG: sugar transferase, partial [Cyclobacteriaceae bacterium]